MSLAYAHPQAPGPGMMQTPGGMLNAPQRAYIQTAQGPIAFNPVMASAAATHPSMAMSSALPGSSMGMGSAHGAHGAAMAGGLGAAPAMGGLSYGAGAGALMSGQAGAHYQHGISTQPNMVPPMSTNPMDSSVPAGAFSSQSPESMEFSHNRPREMGGEQREEGHNDEGDGRRRGGGLFSCCLSPGSGRMSQPDILKAEKRKEKSAKRQEEREKKLREKHEEKVREKHMERMREQH